MRHQMLETQRHFLRRARLVSRSILWIALFILAFTTCLSAQPSGNCSQLPVIALSRGGVEYQVQAAHVLAYPLLANGSRLNGVFLDWDFELIIEREKTWALVSDESSEYSAQYASPDPKAPDTLIEQAFGRNCSDPDNLCAIDPFYVPLDPTERCRGHPVPCGAVLGHIRSTATKNMS